MNPLRRGMPAYNSRRPLRGRNGQDGRREAGEGPAGVVGDEGIVGSSEAFERSHYAGVCGRAGRDAGVPEGDAGVADEAAPLGALYGAAAEDGAELLLRE